MVIPTLTYNPELWTLVKIQIYRKEPAEMRFLRSWKGIKIEKIKYKRITKKETFIIYDKHQVYQSTPYHLPCMS